MINIRELQHNYKEHADQEVTVGGWLRSRRDSKTFGFLVINDGTFFEPLQVVYSDKLDNFAAISKLNVGAAVIATGIVTLTPEAKQPFEIQATKIEIEGDSTPEYPLQKKRHSFEYLRTISHLRPRTNTFQAVFRVRSLCAYAIHKFFQERDFVYVHTPLITGSDCEGAGEMFQVTTLDLKNLPMVDGQVDFSKDFFNKPTNLTVSGHLCDGIQKHLYVWPDLPRGKFQHNPPCGRVLDDRAGDCLCGFEGRYDARRGNAQIYHQLCAGKCAGGDGIFQSVCGQGTD